MSDGIWVPSCGKYGYRNEYTAREVLADRQRVAYSWESPPIRSYRCRNGCGLFHLSSKSSIESMFGQKKPRRS